jgi:hypothetical protein
MERTESPEKTSCPTSKPGLHCWYRATQRSAREKHGVGSKVASASDHMAKGCLDWVTLTGAQRSTVMSLVAHRGEKALQTDALGDS